MVINWDGEDKRVGEEERRKICFLHQKDIQEIKEAIKENARAIHHIETVKIPASESFRKQAGIVGVLALLVWAGSYYYTDVYKDESFIIHERMMGKIESNVKDITDMKGDYRAIIEQIKNLVREVERSNSLTSQIIRSNSDLRRNEVKEVGYEE